MVRPKHDEPPQAAPAQSMAEQAYLAIEEMIVLRRLPPGTMISENQLVEETGCGRTPVREALQRLKLEGYIEIHPRRGALVAPVDILRQLELLEVRRPLEILTVRLAADRATAAQRAEMRVLCDDLRAAALESDIVRWNRVARRVHGIKAAAAHNSVLEKTITVIHGLSRRFWLTYIDEGGHYMDGTKLHVAVLNAIREGRADAAEQHSERLLDYLEQFTRRTLDRTVAQPRQPSRRVGSR